jgi:hypothetical protein
MILIECYKILVKYTDAKMLIINYSLLIIN